jgi:DNA-binding response OmpR family regulator
MRMAHTKQRILCIEDDRETAALLAEELVERGFSVSLAADGDEGLAAIERELPDLILCDICMPRLSGFEVLQRLAARGAPFDKVAFIFLTALTDRDAELEGRRLGAGDFIAKPIDFDALAAIVMARLATVVGRDTGAKVAMLGSRKAEAPSRAGAITMDRSLTGSWASIGRSSRR